jgi:hypothetical protein
LYVSGWKQGLETRRYEKMDRRRSTQAEDAEEDENENGEEEEKGRVGVYINLNILWHADPLLGNDLEISSYTTAVAR